MSSRLDKLTSLQGYNLSVPAALAIIEAADARGKYESLPQASKDAMQSICDMFGIILEFKVYREKLHLWGITKPWVASGLVVADTPYTDDDNAYCKKLHGKTVLALYPGANNELKTWTEGESSTLESEVTTQ